MKKQWILSGLVAVSMSSMIHVPVQAASMSMSQKTNLLNKYMKSLKTERNQYNRAKAAKELGILGDPRALEQLHRSLVTDVSPQVRINSAYAIGRINKKSSVKPLLRSLAKQKGLKSNQVDVLLAIIQAVGDMGKNARDKHTISSIKRLMRSPSPFIREAAIESLWKIRDYSVSPALVYLLATENELIVKLTLTQYIADFKDGNAIPVLERMLKDPKEHIDVKAMAQDALDKLSMMSENGTLRVKQDKNYKLPKAKPKK